MRALRTRHQLRGAILLAVLTLVAGQAPASVAPGFTAQRVAAEAANRARVGGLVPGARALRGAVAEPVDFLEFQARLGTFIAGVLGTARGDHGTVAGLTVHYLSGPGVLELGRQVPLPAILPAATNALAVALEQLGKPYVWGATGPGAFDCSGLLVYSWGRSGVALPRTSYDQYAWAIPVPFSQLAPGDLAFFGRSGVHHVGMYVGGGMMINAPHTGDVVKLAPIWWNDLVGFGRVHSGSSVFPPRSETATPSGTTRASPPVPVIFGNGNVPSEPPHPGDPLNGPAAAGAGPWPISAPGPTPSGPIGPAPAGPLPGTTPPATSPPSPAPPAVTGPTGDWATSAGNVLNGTGAPTGTAGSDGDYYLDTAAGTLYGAKAGGVWPSVGVSLLGPPAPAGPSPAAATMRTLLSAREAPPAGTGVDGAFFLDALDGILYGPRADGVWPATGLNLGGHRGPTAPGPVGPGGTAPAPAKVGILHWYPATDANSFGVGSRPSGVSYDGTNVWVANTDSDTVTKLRASDGAVLGTFAVGSHPVGVTVDRANVWVVNGQSDNVTKLRGSDGTVLGTYAVGSHPEGIAFDGTNMWVTNSASDNVTQLRASDGSVLRTRAVGHGPRAVAFDGTSLWVVNSASSTITRLRAGDGSVLGTYAVGSQPQGITFDGSDMWVANTASNNVTKLRASDGLVMGVFAVGHRPQGIVFDGTDVWVANTSDNNLTKLWAAEGTDLGTYAVGNQPVGAVFDGTGIWVTDSAGNGVTRLPA